MEGPRELTTRFLEIVPVVQKAFVVPFSSISVCLGCRNFDHYRKAIASTKMRNVRSKFSCVPGQKEISRECMFVSLEKANERRFWLDVVVVGADWIVVLQSRSRGFFGMFRSVRLAASLAAAAVGEQFSRLEKRGSENEVCFEKCTNGEISSSCSCTYDQRFFS